ncbi:MAG: uroporphyrinogen decarboxylase family protein [Candidatus Zipacnadales bacterium]
MTKRERIQGAVSGSEVDRVPYSFWYHFTWIEDKAGEEFIKAEIDFATRHEVDFLKVMHDIPYDMPDTLPVIEQPADWYRLGPLEVREGNFGRHLEALKRIKASLPDDRPIVDTVFHCFAYAQRIAAERPLVLEHLQQDWEAVEYGLRVIGETLKRWAKVTIEEEGVIDGIFLAINGISGEFTDADLYERLMMPIDCEVMQAGIDAGGWLNIAHLHGSDIHFDLGIQLPHNALSWSDRAFGPSLAEARAKTDACLIGGVNEVTGDQVAPQDIRQQVREAIQQLGGRRQIVSCGCAFPTPMPEENLKALREAVVEFSG